MGKDKNFFKGTTCECGYYNHESNVKKYGTCKLCGKVLDKKAKFDYEMYCRLRLWKEQKTRNKYGTYNEL